MDTNRASIFAKWIESSMSLTYHLAKLMGGKWLTYATLYWVSVLLNDEQVLIFTFQLLMCELSNDKFCWEITYHTHLRRYKLQQSIPPSNAYNHLSIHLSIVYLYYYLLSGQSAS